MKQDTSHQKDTLKRTIVKTIGFKIFTTGATAIMLGSLGKAIGVHIVMTIIYIIYERVWNKIGWGKKGFIPEVKPVEHHPVRNTHEAVPALIMVLILSG